MKNCNSTTRREHTPLSSAHLLSSPNSGATKSQQIINNPHFYFQDHRIVVQPLQPHNLLCVETITIT